jgi:hypothetical protein
MHRDQIKAFPGNVDLHLQSLAVLRRTPNLFDVVALPPNGRGGEAETGDAGLLRCCGRRWVRVVDALGTIIETLVCLSPLVFVCAYAIVAGGGETLAWVGGGVLFVIIAILGLALARSAKETADRP